MFYSHALAVFNSSMASFVSINLVEASKDWSCSIFVALAIGAVIDGLESSHATATVEGVLLNSAAILSKAVNIFKPVGVRYLIAPSPLKLLLRSALVRYLPVKNPPAKAK